jgi:uncharacterized protein YqgC (DUF456 family)
MKYIFSIFLIMVSFAGFALTIAGFSGTLVVWCGVLFCSALDGFNAVGPVLLGWLFLLAAAGEAIEYFSGIIGAKKFGAGRKGMMGAIIGGIAGVIIFTAILPVIGIVVGVFIGTFAGAFAGEYFSGADISSSSRAGFGALLGRVFAVAVKVLIILVIAGVPIVRFMKM